MFMLSLIEDRISCSSDFYYEQEYNLCFVAYACRKGILMRLKENPSLERNLQTLIRIPTGTDYYHQEDNEETIESGLTKTVTRLKKLASQNEAVAHMVDNVLSGGNLYYQYDKDKTFSDGIKGMF